MGVGVQTFRADGSESYDGYSSIIRVVLHRPLTVNASGDDAQYVKGIYAKWISGRCAVYLAHSGTLYPIYDIRSNDYVVFRNGTQKAHLQIMEW